MPAAPAAPGTLANLSLPTSLATDGRDAGVSDLHRFSPVSLFHPNGAAGGPRPDSLRQGRYKFPNMTIVYATLWLAGLYPFTAAWWAHRRTSLAHAIVWAIVAWVAWGWLFVIEEPPLSGMDPARYIALCLTGAAGIAVLG